METLYLRKTAVIVLLQAVFSGLLRYLNFELFLYFVASASDYMIYNTYYSLYVVNATTNLVAILLALIVYRWVYCWTDRDYLLGHVRTLFTHLFLVVILRMVISLGLGLFVTTTWVGPPSFLQMFILGIYPLWIPDPSALVSGSFVLYLLSIFGYTLNSIIMPYAVVFGLHLWSEARLQSSPLLPNWLRFASFILLFVVTSLALPLIIGNTINSTDNSILLKLYDMLIEPIPVVLLVISIWLVIHVLGDQTRRSLLLTSRVQYFLAAGILLLKSVSFFLYFFSAPARIQQTFAVPALLTIILGVFQSVCLILFIVTLQYNESTTPAPADQELLYQAPLVQSQ